MYVEDMLLIVHRIVPGTVVGLTKSDFSYCAHVLTAHYEHTSHLFI